MGYKRLSLIQCQINYVDNISQVVLYGDAPRGQ